MRLFSNNDQETCKVVTSTDWSNHPLGPIETWNPVLINFLNFIFNSRQPCFLFWGKEAYCFYNDGYIPILGNEKHPIAMGAPAIDVWQEIWTNYTYPQFADAMNGNPSWKIDEFVPISRNGKIVEAYFTYGCSPLYLDDGTINGVLTTALETTDKIVAVKSLNEHQHQLKTAVDVTKLGFFEWDIISDNVVFNDQMQNDWGITANAPIAEVLSHVHPDDVTELSARIQSSVESSVPDEMVYRVIHPTLGVRWVEAKGQVEYADGKPVRLFGTSVNVTAKHSALLALESARKEIEQYASDLQHSLNTRDEFLSIASHELKTPITSLKLQLQMVKRRLMPSEEKIGTGIIQALRHVDRLTELVDKLLDVSKIQQGKMNFDFHEVEVHTLIDEVIERLSDVAKSAGSQIEASCPNHLLANWDRSRIDQVLVNLLSNAIKYAPGTLVSLNVTSIDDEVKISIKDGGKGIPEENLEKIFERFERTGASKNVSGLGLGLYIVKQIVLGHKGTIEVKSEMNRGAEFIITLPKSL